MSAQTPLARALARVCEGSSLTAQEAAAAFDQIMAGEATPALIGGLLAALRVKGETVAELVGAARAMRRRAERVTSRKHPLVDTCGTGGDGGRTFSVSTVAALIAAGAGVAVAKHGNRAASGRFGGADALEALGVAIDLSPERASLCLDEVGMAFLFAPRMHPAMRHAAPVRRELGVRTIFNLLGPLCNPAGVQRQVVGVPSPRALQLVAGALAELGCEHALVAHSRDGLDEISLAAPTDVIEVKGRTLHEIVIDATSFGLEPVPSDAICVESLAESVAVLRDILSGVPGPQTEIAIANAGAALYVGGASPSLRDGARRARESVDSGAARGVLERLIAFTNAPVCAERG